MKKLLALVLALCTAAALCACGHDSAAKTKPNEENTADKGTLTLAYWEENCPEWWEKVYADTGIKVEYEQIASADYANIMSTRVKAAKRPTSSSPAMKISAKCMLKTALLSLWLTWHWSTIKSVPALLTL